MSKTILDLCGGTGAWSKPFADAGYNVKIITLPEYNIMRNDIGNNEITFYRTHDAHYSGGISLAYSDIYGTLAAPPCTEFSLAKNGSPTERNFEEGMKIVHACLKIIWASPKHPEYEYMNLTRAELRGITPAGFAKAFYKANSERSK